VNLTNAMMVAADLTGANLTETNLTVANLTNADLTGVTWFYTFCPTGISWSVSPQTCCGQLNGNVPAAGCD